MNRYLIYYVHVFFRKANNLFEKNAAPILYLAGVEIKVVKVCLFVYLF